MAGNEKRFGRLGVAVALALALAALPAANAAAAESIRTIGLTHFDFSATSGESGSQASVHAARMQKLADALRKGLEATGHFHVITLPCPGDPCVETPADGTELLKTAKKQGAALVVIGGVNKMTSVVLFLKAEVFDVATNKPVFSKLYTLRGDNDAAYVLAGQKLAQQINAHG